jgi:hypothetical protein
MWDRQEWPRKVEWAVSFMPKTILIEKMNGIAVLRILRIELNPNFGRAA